jgi:anti-sigma factor RsiW
VIGSGSGRWSWRTDAGHLALDAVVAFVDGELPPGPAQRAAAHVDHCLSCAAEVAAQRQARRRVRGAAGPAMPSSLYAALCSIPDAAPLPGLPAGLAAGPGGEIVAPAEEPRGRRRGRRRTLGVPVALSSGVVVGAAALAALTGPVVAAGTPAPTAPTAPPPPGSAVPVVARTLPAVAAADLSLREATPEPGLRGPGAP